MKIFKSIKWRLQLWYGLILVVVLAGFGFTAYQLERGRVLRKVDDELNMRLHLITDALHPPPHRPGFGPPPPDRPPEGPPMGAGLDNELPRPTNQFQLSAWAEHFFGTNDGQNFYYVVWSRYGDEIAREGAVPTHMTAMKAAEPVDVRTLDGFREIHSTFPLGEQITVGRSLAPELKDLRLTAWRLTAVGTAILLVGLVGGGWLVGRALRPIDGISAAAVKISAGDLTQRINVAETESELGRLASVLNSTFARLETAFAQQQQFTADAAHELRTPVSVVLTQTQTALNRERSPAEYRETIEACQRSAQRMRRLIESLLELARLDTGQETLKRLCFNLAETVNECAEQMKPIASQRNVNILTGLAPVEIIGDAERLALVITNLLVNAIQYNRPGGEVRVKLEASAGLAVLTVSDTGPGISGEDLPHVFERFYRGDKSRTTSNGNAGLGLAISKAIVEAHGGTIEVSSRENVGSTFTVRLPLG